MNIFKKKVSISSNSIGFLFKENVWIETLKPGVYKYFDFNNNLLLVELPNTAKMIHIVNQEVLTKDNIALRFSFAITYKIQDGEKFLAEFNIFNGYGNFYDAETLLKIKTQVYLREKISTYESSLLNEFRDNLTASALEDVGNQFLDFGILITDIVVVDITFPKMIQDLFSKELESKIRAKSDLENARTAVATACTLKNAADMMKQNEEVKFIQMLETIIKIADKGKHTFHFGDMVKGKLM